MGLANFARFRFGGGMRFRSVLAPYDPTDLTLDRRFVTFDSAGLNSFRVKDSGVVAGSLLPEDTVTYGLGAASRKARRLTIPGVSGPNRPTLAWQRIGPGALSGPSGNIDYQRGYGVCGVTLGEGQILLSPSNAGHDYVFFCFEVNPLASESSGLGGWARGNHPLYGPGLFVARPGADPLTASLDDMALTSHRNHFQISESGLTGTATYAAVSNDPFPTHAASAARAAFLVNLGRSYPHYPPVIAFPTNGFTSGGPHLHRHSCSIFWINSSQILILSSFATENPIRWAIVGSNPVFSIPSGGPLVRRIVSVRGEGMFMTQPAIDYFAAATENDFLFRTDRQTPRFQGFGAIPAGAPTSATPYDLPDPPPVGGPPFAFFLISEAPSYNSWWCGCGMVVTQDIFTPAPAYYGPFYCAFVTSRTQYKWYRNPDYSGVYYDGKVAIMNVSDFT